MITANTWFRESWPMFRKKSIIPSQLRHGIQPTSLDLELPPVMVYAGAGAWQVLCPGPGCRGSEYAWEEGFFYCFSCHNNYMQHRMRRLRFPENREGIEAILDQRPLLNRNWNESETIEDLRLENKAHASELLPV